MPAPARAERKHAKQDKSETVAEEAQLKYKTYDFAALRAAAAQQRGGDVHVHQLGAMGNVRNPVIFGIRTRAHSVTRPR